jgi:hypothetical protein
VRHFRIVGPPRAPSAGGGGGGVGGTPGVAGLPTPSPGAIALTYRARDVTPNLGDADLLDFEAPEAKVAVTLDAALFVGGRGAVGVAALAGERLGAWCYRE